MNPLSLSTSRRAAAWLWTSLIVAWLAAGCDIPGGVGDGNYDDSVWPGGATSSSAAGKGNSAQAGTTSASGGSSGQSGIAGRAGMSSVGGAFSAGGTAGASGASGSVGTAGSAGTMVGTGGSSAGSGAGGLMGSGGKAGSGGSGGSSSGGSGPTTCGNGVVDSGETCDDGPLGGSSAGSGGMPGAGGGSEEPGRGGSGPVVATFGQKCSNSCYKVSTQECLECEVAGDCVESVNNCLGVDSPFDSGQQTACFAVMRCIQSSNCFDGTNTVGKCYCGDLATIACGSAPFSGAGSPNGACVNEIKAGFPTFTSNSAILGGLTTATGFPSGAAMKRLSCQKGASGNQCQAACGFTSGGPAFP